MNTGEEKYDLENEDFPNHCESWIASDQTTQQGETTAARVFFPRNGFSRNRKSARLDVECEKLWR
jgi:hypothetical protein